MTRRKASHYLNINLLYNKVILIFILLCILILFYLLIFPFQLHMIWQYCILNETQHVINGIKKVLLARILLLLLCITQNLIKI